MRAPRDRLRGALRSVRGAKAVRSGGRGRCGGGHGVRGLRRSGACLRAARPRPRPARSAPPSRRAAPARRAARPRRLRPRTPLGRRPARRRLRRPGPRPGGRTAAAPADLGRPPRAPRSPTWCRAARWSIIAVVVVLASSAPSSPLTLGGGDDRPRPERQGRHHGVRRSRGGRRPTARATRQGGGRAKGGRRTGRAPRTARCRRRPATRRGRPDDGRPRVDDRRRPATGGPGDAVPAGYEKVTDDRFHFTMAMPEGFRSDCHSGRELRRHLQRRARRLPAGSRSTSTATPKDDAAAAWTEPVAQRHGASATATSTSASRRSSTAAIRPSPTGSSSADQDGVRVRVLNRGFKVDAEHGYAIMISCKVDEWDGDAVQDAARDGVRHVHAHEVTRRPSRAGRTGRAGLVAIPARAALPPATYRERSGPYAAGTVGQCRE